jgi:hypothetical protein
LAPQYTHMLVSLAMPRMSHSAAPGVKFAVGARLSRLARRIYSRECG